jgi:hypothetical protein
MCALWVFYNYYCLLESNFYSENDGKFIKKGVQFAIEWKWVVFRMRTTESKF